MSMSVWYFYSMRNSSQYIINKVLCKNQYVEKVFISINEYCGTSPIDQQLIGFINILLFNCC